MTTSNSNANMQDETKALALRAQSQAITKFNPEKIRIEAQALRSLMPKQYGKRDDRGEWAVTDEQLTSLVIASLSSGLSPARGEIYFLPGSGVMVASKITAADAVAEQERLGNSLDIRFEKVTADMCELAGSIYARFSGAIRPGDVARACRIVSSKARRDYYAIRAAIAEEGRAYELRGAALMQFVTEHAGPAPETIALGIVRASEKFGGDEKYSREDRAAKRALKAALTMGGYWAMDRRNYGGVRLHDDIPASDETVDGEYTVSAPEPFSAGVTGAEELEPLMPVSESNRARLSSLIDLSQSIKGRKVKEMSAPEREEFAAALHAFIVEVNAQLSARGMEPINPSGSVEAINLSARVLEAMREHDTRAPIAPATPEPMSEPA